MASKFRILLLRISDHITVGNLEKLKFLCSDVIEEGELEEINSPLKLFKALERRELVGVDNLLFLRELLANVKCFQMATEVDDFTLRREIELTGLKEQRQKQRCSRCVEVDGTHCSGNDLPKCDESDIRERGSAVPNTEDHLTEMYTSHCHLCSRDHSSQRKPGEVHLKAFLKLASKGAWFVGTAFVLKRYLDDPETLAQLFATVVLPSGILVKCICEGSILCVLEASDLQALHTLWQNYKTGMLQKALEEVLITDDLQKLSDGQEIILNVVLDEKMYRDVCLELMLNNKQVDAVYKVIEQRPRSVSVPIRGQLGKPEHTFQEESFRIMANTERKRRLDAEKKLDKLISGQRLDLPFPELLQLGTDQNSQDPGDDSSSTTSTSTWDEEEVLDWEEELENEPSREFWSSIKGGFKEKPWTNFEVAINEEFSDDLKRGGSPLLKFLAYVLRVNYDKRTSENVSLRSFIRMSRWFGSFVKGSQGCLRKMINLMEHSVSVGSDGKRTSWFAGYMTEEEAKKKLRNEKGGTFLVRFNTSMVAPGFVLSKKSRGNNTVAEFNIEVHKNTGRVEFGDRIFRSLPSLVTELRESWMTDLQPFYSTARIMGMESTLQQEAVPQL